MFLLYDSVLRSVGLLRTCRRLGFLVVRVAHHMRRRALADHHLRSVDLRVETSGPCQVPLRTEDRYAARYEL